MIPSGWNRQGEASKNQQDPGTVEGALEEDMFPGGWNSRIEKNNTAYFPDHIQSAVEKKEMIPSGWISQREALYTQHHPCHNVVQVSFVLEGLGISLLENIFRVVAPQIYFYLLFFSVPETV